MKNSTPTPWEQYGSLIVHFGERGQSICELSGAPKLAHVVHSCADIGDLAKGSVTNANAALIVTAVNSHEAMKEALRQTIANQNKVIDWLARLAGAADRRAEDAGVFGTLRDANEADAKNYRATAVSVSLARAAAERALALAGEKK